MSFRQFINESGIGAGGVDARFTITKLPSLYQGAVGHHAPAGGYTSIGQMGQHYTAKMRQQDPDYMEQQILQKFAELAENAAAAIQNRASGAAEMSHAYENARYINDVIVNLLYTDITSGSYPRLRNEDVEKGKQLGVLIGPKPGSSSTNGIFDLNVGILRQRMMEMRQKASTREHGYESIGHLAGVADKAIGSMNTGTLKGTNDASINPLGSH